MEEVKSRPRAGAVIRINAAIQGLLPPLTRGEYASLKADIAARGQQLPIIAEHETGDIIDGHHRYRICQELGIEPRVEYRIFADEGGKMDYALAMNLRRRQLTSSQLAACAVEALPFYEGEARGRQGARTDLNIPEKIQGGWGEAAERAGHAFGVSGRYVHEARRVRETAPDLFEKVRAGEWNIAASQKELNRRRKASRPTPPLPPGKYNVILADPPWPYDLALSHDRAIERHYPTMTIEEICALPVASLAADNATLFLWCTAPGLLDAAPRVISAWGFEYITNFAWVKDKIGTGYWCRNQHELLLVCRRGDVPPPGPGPGLPSSVVFADRRGHSVKPDAVYGIIEGYFPNGKKLELFGRVRREGWDAWGDELPPDEGEGGS